MYIGEKKVTLIHYIGNEGIVAGFPHRNTTNDSNKSFVRTCPSYLKKCEMLVDSKKANVVYKKEVANMSCDPKMVPVELPRNLKQLRNLRVKCLNNSRISRDALFNLHEIAYDTAGFIWKITTYPDLLCIIGLQEILAEADRILSLKSNFQLLSYDTTFQLGDFYVSPLIIRHCIFKERPCIPAMFLIHERKFMDTHQEMFKECVKRIPCLKKTKSPLVTDKERAIVNAIKRELPEVKLLYCWNHIFRDIRTWCRKHGAPSGDISFYTDDVRQLLHSNCENDYKIKLEERRKVWDAAFETYYMQEIHPSVAESFARWILEEHHVYNPYSGITNNQSESFNR